MTWDVPHPDHELVPPHPFIEWCDAVKRVEAGRFIATIGVKVGPTAADLRDPAYLEFRDGWRRQFQTRISAMEPGLSFNILPGAVRTGNVMAERFTGTAGGGANVASLVTTVHDGHAFAYLFAGPSQLLRPFNEAVGLAKPLPPADAAVASE